MQFEQSASSGSGVTQALGFCIGLVTEHFLHRSVAMQSFGTSNHRQCGTPDIVQVQEFPIQYYVKR